MVLYNVKLSNISNAKLLIDEPPFQTFAITSTTEQEDKMMMWTLLMVGIGVISFLTFLTQVNIAVPETFHFSHGMSNES